jgi:hypothetical protein
MDLMEKRPSKPSMATMKWKRRFILFAITVGLFVSLIFALANMLSIRVAYHSWRMNAEFNKIFGEPQLVVHGLAGYNVTGIDVDAVLAKYEAHRQQLVNLKVLAHLQADIPQLVSDGTEQQSELRRQFTTRMWDRFPQHRHYYLAGNGSFETWVPIEIAGDWSDFIKFERLQNRKDNHDKRP